MDRLWTPWRMAYVGSGGSKDDEGCFLCHHASAPTADDDKNLVLHRAEHAFVVLNRYPYNSGHLMVAPLAHVGELQALDATIGHALWDLARHAVGVLQQEYRPDGYNLGMNLGRVAGAGLPGHLHIHVVPRWNGDTNFMPVTADTKVMPEALDQTYRRLKPRFS
jgi:ATP adenylyltransferase